MVKTRKSSTKLASQSKPHSTKTFVIPEFLDSTLLVSFDEESADGKRLSEIAKASENLRVLVVDSPAHLKALRTQVKEVAKAIRQDAAGFTLAEYRQYEEFANQIGVKL